MDVLALLEAASLLPPHGTPTDNTLTADDLWDYLAHDQWEIALTLLEELRGTDPLPTGFWKSMAEAAEELRLERSRAWCWWRWGETRSGVLRAELTLRPAAETGRLLPVLGAGVLRPLWNVGNRAPDGGISLNIASLWVENALELPPGGTALVRLLPLTPSQWRHVAPGDVLTMHESAPVAGTATVLEVGPPVEPPLPAAGEGPR
ncbi:hypothetical protein [Streptomyces albireticuli]|uniref:Uncharacterized protein n=1 Tax=Streptomyces albireticuli TaxID=1940 RepID=A0A2A2CYD2_9ACTN|nr:hypothetical protein [Streptomyces albireticuli]MCD9145061.1 hypothetical protein [Streptomyces albireticuli]MCD9164487.1 hypothetical protein [Streptomyces albireticuli]MCD9194198.1 hypothetical protein [Streptomyces albireticuli]PAU44120.1 hypothetical protein CK936_36545 [Streptomyces albireticuli]